MSWPPGAIIRGGRVVVPDGDGGWVTAETWLYERDRRSGSVPAVASASADAPSDSALRVGDVIRFGGAVRIEPAAEGHGVAAAPAESLPYIRTAALPQYDRPSVPGEGVDAE
jgi:hypothetical protein